MQGKNLVGIFFVFLGVVSILPFSVLNLGIKMLDFKSNNANFGAWNLIANQITSLLISVAYILRTPKQPIAANLILIVCANAFLTNAAALYFSLETTTFSVICALANLLTCCSGTLILCNTLNLLQKFNVEFTNLFNVGTNISALLANVCKFFIPDQQYYVFYLLTASLAVALLIAQEIIAKKKYFKDQIEQHTEQLEQALRAPLTEKRGISALSAHYKKDVAKFATLWLDFFGTMTIYPIFSLAVVLDDPPFQLSISTWQFLTVYLAFCVFTVIGTCLASVWRISGKILHFTIVAKTIIFWCLFTQVNYQPKRTFLPCCLLGSDYMFLILTCLLAALYGFCTSCSLINLRTLNNVKHTLTANIVIMAGISGGTVFSTIYSLILKGE